MDLAHTFTHPTLYAPSLTSLTSERQALWIWLRSVLDAQSGWSFSQFTQLVEALLTIPSFPPSFLTANWLFFSKGSACGCLSPLSSFFLNEANGAPRSLDLVETLRRKGQAKKHCINAPAPLSPSPLACSWFAPLSVDGRDCWFMEW